MGKKILNVNFSEKRYEEFKKLTKEDQIKFLKERNKLLSLEEIKDSLSYIDYAKSSRTTKKSKKSSEKGSDK